MNTIRFVASCLCVMSWACSTSSSGEPQTSSGSSGNGNGQSGASSGAASGTGSTGSGASNGSGLSSGSSTGSASGSASGAGGSGTASGGGSGTASGTAASGTASGAAASGTSSGGSGGSAGASSGAVASGSTSGSSSGAASGSINFDGGVNMIPAGYTGTPFVQNVIPGFVYAANYDKGGPGIAYCHSATATGAACAGGIVLRDWCCSACNATMTGARCDARTAACPGMLMTCPLYRPDTDNAGLSHMNLGEVDTYAVAGPTWVPGPNGPTLTGPMVTVGTPVPQHANMTTEDDTYLSYTNTGQWQKYTVEVLSAGTYSIGALMGTPPNVKITMDFGNGVTTGMLALPASPVTAACKCAEAYHAWNPVANVGTIMFPAAGTYLMTMTINAGNYNPLYFTFTKM